MSARYQVVIPKDVREQLELTPGQRLQALPFKGRVELIPLEPIEAARGFVRGIDTDVPREGDRV
ncbi:MAG: AbrB/MazE/SpoVT family DNA-binding domain-containing protein [Gemmatimonadetes bacterium]|nr:AbrB/MazE/SpoVT family DNA-binding domain-containing protein [Gemmatimonadota bacterium]MCY3610910.1 AbrB/MazE/SpoVT family DNA-binding domain-containing protein [Gemmatimonadota bacterium]MCY3676576.1 AbrB/MazE/SpoVT family DNA-binding domain-containing protein [Gemmatimonadota bacterium]MYA43252.1 AbrB/MazE/SpoVT family DNA-binding domain-containing protein [Gemmatimonadota bacterium]MYE92265.1 AbrB/MazE/SpoVT family DNA-binding domain-containing protein [Gemmatimonadota bacterium]